MLVQIRPAAASDLAAMVPLALLAWAPVFASFRRVLGPEISHLGPFSRSLQRLILDKISYGECDTAYWGKGCTRCECVLVNDVPVFVLYNYLQRELVTVIPPEDWRIAKYLRWRRSTLRQRISLAHPHDQRLGRRVTNAQVFHDLTVASLT
jgi:hypothetical protein